MTGGPADLVRRFLDAVDVTETLEMLGQLCEFDRYQASTGIANAANIVAERIAAIGLTDVRIATFPADGARQWWSFQAPTAWTPRVARLEVDGASIRIDHARHPFAIATYSAATAGTECAAMRRVDEDLQGHMSGTVALVDRRAYRADMPAKLAAVGALGFATDAASQPRGAYEAFRGRLELPANTTLFGFSVTTEELAQLRAVADAGLPARVTVDIDRSARMPVVSGVLPGRYPGPEVWVTSHLCHPRPGANDNASGVAAALGSAAALARLRADDSVWLPDYPVRFAFGPEFVGTAAMLHRQLSTHGRAGLPAAVVNLDMVGEDQALYSGPFRVERGPDLKPSLINPTAERLLDEVFAQTVTSPGVWRPVTFRGFSDHALFADPAIACPAVQFCHPDDPYNHSDGDTVDRVSPVEMRRATAAASALAYVMASPNPASRHEWLANAVRSWCASEFADAESLAATTPDTDWGAGLISHVQQNNQALTRLLAGEQPDNADSVKPTGVRRHWDGPLNVRAMRAELSPTTQQRVTELIDQDKDNLSVLLNFGIRVDGRRDREQIIAETSYAMRKPLDRTTAGELFDAFEESGWITTW